ncbi:hypothetical protein D3C76_1760390 [compost metagenome]
MHFSRISALRADTDLGFGRRGYALHTAHDDPVSLNILNMDLRDVGGNVWIEVVAPLQLIDQLCDHTCA